VTLAELRAAGLAVVLLANLAVALPLPKSVKRSNFDLPVAREELSKLSAVLGVFGAPPTHDALADFLYASGKPLVGLRAALTAPTKEPFRILGMGQSWGLFTYPDTFPHRLVVDARSERWARVYAGLDPEHTFLREIFA
jgi:hypothetical protein